MPTLLPIAAGEKYHEGASASADSSPFSWAVASVSSSSVRFRCPFCGAAIKALVAQAGEPCHCPKCHAQTRVPVQGGEQPEPSAAAATDPALDPRAATVRPPRSNAVDPPSAERRSRRGELSPAPVARSERAAPRVTPRAAVSAEATVRCPLCRAAVAIAESKLGQVVQCPDCHSQFSALKKIAPQPRSSPATEEADADFPLSAPVQTPRYVPSAAEGVDADELYGESATPASGSPSPSEPSPLQFGVTCPLCHSRLYVTRAQVGQRLRCPDCHTDFDVPGPRAIAPPRSVVSADVEDEFALSEPASLPKYEPLTRGEITRAELDALEGKRPVPQQATPRRTQPRPPDFEVVCRHCGSHLPVREEQIGHRVRCGDCHSQQTVTRPRPKRRPPAAAEDGSDEPLTVGPTAADAARLAPGESSLRWLSRAQREEDEKQPPRPTLDGLSYPRKLLGFLFELGTVMRIVGLSIGLAILMFLGSQIFVFSAGAMVVFVVVIITFCVVVLVPLAMYWANCVLAIVTETSTNSRSVEEWSDDMIIDWVAQAAFVFTAMLVSSAPAAAIAGALSVISDSPWISVVLLAISSTIFFPLVLLSILDAGHLLQFYSREIWSSLWTSPGVWLRLYATTVVLGGVLLAILVVVNAMSFWLIRLAGVLSPLAAFLLVAVSFAYFRAIGLAAAECGLVEAAEAETR